LTYLALHLDAAILLTGVVCTCAILTAVGVLRSFQSPRVRGLVGILSFVTVAQSVQVLDSRLSILPDEFFGFEELLALMVAILCLVAISTLGMLGKEQTSASFRIRLFEAEEKSAPKASKPVRTAAETR
jgi:hypothetical protein